MVSSLVVLLVVVHSTSMIIIIFLFLFIEFSSRVKNGGLLVASVLAQGLMERDWKDFNLAFFVRVQVA